MGTAATFVAIATAIVAGCLAVSACDRDGFDRTPGNQLERQGDEIAACGQLFHTGTRVVLWTDPHGYDAYRTEPRFPEEMKPEVLDVWKVQPSLSPLRSHVSEAVRKRVLARGWTLAELQDSVDQFVMHFDVCGTSRRCFKVLHDQRFLSVHFLLDVDGVIYQTMDLKERAYHAKQANDRSIGVEIAHIGCYTDRNGAVFKEWYSVGAEGVVLRFPAVAFPAGTGILTEGFVGHPARKEMVSGPIHGTTYWQYDFTSEQYAALAKLVAAVNRVLPGIEIDAPRGKGGTVLTRALSEAELGEYSGLLGHFHVTDQKTDPGPAFDWERVIREARSQ